MNLASAESYKYGIIGHNIGYSVSPAMHNSAFLSLELPHTFELIDLEKVDDFFIGTLWNSEKFRGCSVTIPHKQNVMPYVDRLSDAAREIGSVNTLLKEVKKEGEGFEVYGDNTDWIGMRTPLSRSSQEGGLALILGGGGTARAAAYAARSLGLTIFYYNRTPEKVVELANTFGGKVLQNLEEEGLLAHALKQGKLLNVVISTLPANVGFELPGWIISRKPTIFDVNYKPYHTKLLIQAEGMGCEVVRGSEMLWEQGVGQFELWTGETAPYEVMKRTVLRNCLPEE